MFSPLTEERYALGLETIYEGYLLHYDYLYAHGLVRVAEAGTVEAVADLAALISRCAQLRADGLTGDGEEWAAAAATLGLGEATRSAWEPGAEARIALAKHAALVE